MSVCRTRVSYTPGLGSCGNGFSSLSFVLKLVRVSDNARLRVLGTLRTMRSRSRRDATGGRSDSSLDVDGVEDVIEGDRLPRGLMASMRTSRTSETDIVASDAISRTSVDERGHVVKTTKYDTEPLRENVAGLGRVT